MGPGRRVSSSAAVAEIDIILVVRCLISAAPSLCSRGTLDSLPAGPPAEGLGNLILSLDPPLRHMKWRESTTDGFAPWLEPPHPTP